MKISVSCFNKNEESIGFADIFIYKESFTKKEKNIKKWLAVNNETQRKSMIQTQSAKFAHTVTHLIKMLLKITIDYDVKNYVEPVNTIVSKNNINNLNTTNQNNGNNNNSISNNNNGVNILNNLKRTSMNPGSLTVDKQDKQDKQEKRQSIAAQIMNQLGNIADKKRTSSVGGSVNNINNTSYHNNANNANVNTNTPKGKEAPITNLNIVKCNNDNELVKTESKNGKKDGNKSTNPMNMSMMNMDRKSLLLEDSPIQNNPKPIQKNNTNNINKKLESDNKSKPKINNKKPSPWEDKHKANKEKYDKYHKNFNDKINHGKNEKPQSTVIFLFKY